MVKLEVLEEIHGVIIEKQKIYDQLEEEQASYLNELMTNNRHLIEWFANHGYMFTHPMIKYRSSKGPVLHQVENEVYVWSLAHGIQIYDLFTKKFIGDSTIYHLLREDGFINAIQGLLYTEESLKNHLIEREDEIRHMEKELESVKNY